MRLRHPTKAAIAALVLGLSVAASVIYTNANAQPAPTPAWVTDAAPAAEVPAAEAPAAEAPAPAPEAAPEDDFEKKVEDPFGSVAGLVKAVKEGDYRAVAGFLIVLLLFLGRNLRDRVAWFKGDRGGTVLVFVMATLGAVGTGLFAGVDVDAKLFWAAFNVGLLAIGGYTAIKKLIWPDD